MVLEGLMTTVLPGKVLVSCTAVHALPFRPVTFQMALLVTR